MFFVVLIGPVYFYPIASGLCQGCVIAPMSFATSVDWLIERSVGNGMKGISFGQCSFTDLDFADDVLSRWSSLLLL